MSVREVWDEMVGLIADAKEQKRGAVYLPLVQVERWAYELESEELSGQESDHE